MHALNIILGPIITEKSMNESGKGRYTFKVTVGADKKSIKKAVEEKFKVNVTKVTTVIVKGRSSRAGVRRIESLNSVFKKAVVTVKTGQKIGIFDTGTQTS